MAALAVAMVVMAFGPTGSHLPAALVIGLRSTLNSLVILVLMEADQVTSANAGLAYGLWFSAVEVGGASGPPIVGAFGDADVGYTGALVAMAAMLVVMMLVLFRADRATRATRPAPFAGLSGPLPTVCHDTTHEEQHGFRRERPNT
jgi:cyanate permease